MRRYLFSALFLLATAGDVGAAPTCPVTQSSPAFNAGGNVFGRIAAQWNSYFAAKVDANGGVLCNPTIIINQSVVPTNPIVFVSPTSGSTLTALVTQSGYVMTPAGVLATLSIILPPITGDQQVFTISTTQTIDALTVSGAGTATMGGSSGGPYMFTANGGASWIYNLTQDKWFPRS